MLMEILFSLLGLFQKALSGVGPFFLLLGVLIFIHELGHFLAARYFGVKVEVFSLGFGPKILKYKKGDTVYCISLFPLGGYVKMFGDNPLVKIDLLKQSQGFLYKKVHEKWIIAFAGPFMNFIFTLVAFFTIAFIGDLSFKPVLGDVNTNSQAYLAGFRSGDQVLSAGGQKVFYYKELNKIIKNNTEKEIAFTVKSQTNNIKQLKAIPKEAKNPNPLEWKKLIGSIEGLSPSSIGLKLGIVKNSPAYKAGLRTFDTILKINNQELKYLRDLEPFLTRLQNTSSLKKIKLYIEREQEKKEVFLKLPTLKTSLKTKKSLLDFLGIEPGFLYIQQVNSKTPAALAGLKKGDRIVSIDKKVIKTWDEVLHTVQSSKGRPLALTYQRGEEVKTISIAPKPIFIEGNMKTRFMLGIASGISLQGPEPVVHKRFFLESLAFSVQETVKWIGYISVGFVRLFEGELSFRTLAGPVTIGRVAHHSFHQGLLSFLLIMALISLNLGFLNLLPIPLLDGGHILFFTIEGILGRPLPVKKLIVAQQIGLVFLLSFMGLVFFNDIYNWIRA